MHKLNFKIWVEGEEAVFLGNGRIRLLEAIDHTGSITAAAKEMGMSYKKAWEQVDSMNHQASEPLVITISGGKGGGGTMVTEHGKRVIAQFTQVKNACREFVESWDSKVKF